MNGNNIIYFDSFGVGHIPKEVKKFKRNKNIIINLYRIQAYDSIICGYFCIGFIDFKRQNFVRSYKFIFS